LPWTDDVPEPERDLDELRDVVARKAGRLRNRRRLGLVSGAAGLLAVLLVLSSLPGGDNKPRRLQAANRPETSTTVDPSSDDTFDPSEVYGEEPTTTAPGQTTSTTAKRKAGTATPTSTAPLPPCGTPEERLSSAETSTALVGAWVLCRGDALFATGEAGIEIGADGAWSKLVRTTDGSLQRSSGWENNGDWAVVQEQQVNFRMVRGTVIASAYFTADRASVRFMGMGGGPDYVRVASGTPIGDAPPRGGDECSKDEGRRRMFSSESEVRAALAHVWLLCQPEWYFAAKGAGLEIRSDGRWYLLDRRADGALVRGGGRLAGTWTVMDTSSMNGPGSYQLNVRADGSGENYLIIAFATASSKMQASSMEGVRDHVHAPAGTQVVDG
jgi:hypothetical protein